VKEYANHGTPNFIAKPCWVLVALFPPHATADVREALGEKNAACPRIFIRASSVFLTPKCLADAYAGGGKSATSTQLHLR